MPRTLFLHIGLHKTGTTSIQRTMNANAEVLAAQGFGYVTGETKSQSFHGYLSPAEFDAEPARTVKLDDAEKMLAVLTAPPQDKIIASSESFSYLFGAQEIAEIAKVLKSAFETVRIICYIRRQDQLAVSHHQQGARPRKMPATGLYGTSPTALPKLNPEAMKYLDYEKRLGYWADAFGDEAMIIRVFGRNTLKDGDSVADFMEQIGLAPEGVVMNRESNQSRGAVKTKLGHILNELVSSEPIRMGIFNSIPDDGKLLPARREAMDFLGHFQDGNRRLNARFRISDNPDLFDQNFASYPEEPADRWTEEMADQAIRAMAAVIEELAADKITLTVDDMREAALALEASHPVLAKRLLRVAVRAKPDAEGLRRHLRKIRHGKVGSDSEEEAAPESAETHAAAKAAKKAMKSKTGAKTKDKAARGAKGASRRATAKAATA